MRNIFLLAFLLMSSLANASNTLSYPDRAERLRIDGEVNVLYDINDDGNTENIRIFSATPEHVFNRSVKKQISFWHYPEGDPKKNVPLKVIFKAN